MAIAFVQSKSSSGSSTAPSVTFNSTPQHGNTIVAMVFSASATSISLAGWSSQTTITGGSGSTARAIAIFSKRVGYNEPTQVTATAGNAAWTMSIAEYSGISSVSTVNAANSQVTASSQTHTTPTVSTSGSGSALVLSYAGIRVSGTWSGHVVNSVSTGVLQRETVSRTTASATFYEKYFSSISGSYNSASTSSASATVGAAAIVVFNQQSRRYWVGGTADWDGTAGSKWSETSGGSGGASVPGTTDDVFFDANSGSVTVTVVAGGGTCKNLNFTGFTGTFAGNQGSVVYGSVRLGSGMTYSYTGNIQPVSNDVETITTNGVTLNGNVTVNNSNGTFHLTDDYTSNQNLGCSAGTLNTNNVTVSVAAIPSATSLTRTINLGSSSITLKGAFGFVWNTSTTTGLTLNAGTSTITVNDTSTGAKTFAGGGLVYNNVIFSGDNITVSGSNTFNSFAVSNAGRANGLLLTSGTTQTVSSFSTNGSAGNLAKLLSTSSGSPATLSKSSGTVLVDYMSIKDSTATGGATWYAGLNSTDVSGNSGWIFTSGAQDYPITASLGTFTYTGVNALLNIGLTMSVISQSFSFTGLSSVLRIGKSMAVSVGSFALSGIDILYNRGRNMATSVGSFLFTGNDSILKISITFILEKGAFALSSITTRFRFSGWTNSDKKSSTFNNTNRNASTFNNMNKSSASTWSDGVKNASTFNNQSKNTSSWINESKSL